MVCYCVLAIYFSLGTIVYNIMLAIFVSLLHLQNYYNYFKMDEIVSRVANLDLAHYVVLLS